MFRSPPPDFHPAKARLLPRLLPGEKRSECPGNPTNTRRKPGFYLVNVGFRARNNNMPVKQAPRVTDSSVGKITFKCNH